MLGLAVLVLPAWAGCASGGAPPYSPGAPVSLAPARTPEAAPASRGGADVLVGSMRRAVLLSGAGAWGEVLINADGLRNQSHATRPEFDAMRQRLVDELSAAGRRGGVPLRFVQPVEQADFEVAGTAYLVTAGGFDLWELYLELRPAGESWSIWSADGPVKMLRQPRGDGEILEVPR